MNGKTARKIRAVIKNMKFRNPVQARRYYQATKRRWNSMPWVFKHGQLPQEHGRS